MKKSIWGKIGWFLVAQSVGIMSLCMQLCCGIVVMMVIAVMVGMTYDGPVNDTNQLMQIVQTRYLENAMIGVVFYHILGILVFGLWYYFAYGKKKRPEKAEKPGIKGISMICVVGVLLQILISGLLGVLMEIFPQAFESYFELMEAAGIMEVTFLSIFATVILAPIGEELLCRGVIMRLAHKVSMKFWVINCIQALAFGIIHGNLVQGTYAFFLGLVLGYVYQKYHNIWMCMLLHAVINLSSQFADWFFELVTGKQILPTSIVCVAAAVLLMISFKVMGKIRLIEE